MDVEIAVDSDDYDTKPAAKPSKSDASAKPLSDDTTVSKGCNSGYVDIQTVEGELPFLVTHWLSGIAEDDSVASEERALAIQKIQQAAVQLSSAFATLGAFGYSMRTNFQSTTQTLNASIPLTYQDMKRSWSSCPSERLEHLVKSNQSAAIALNRAMTAVTAPNHIQASSESLFEALRKPDEHSGRTLQDSIILDGDGNENEIQSVGNVRDFSSALHTPVLFATETTTTPKAETSMVKAKGSTSYVPWASCLAEYFRDASNAMRHYLSTRTKCQEEEARIRSLQCSLDRQRTTTQELERQQSTILSQKMSDSETVIAIQLDEIMAAMKNSERVIAQLELQLPNLLRSHSISLQELLSSREAASSWFEEIKHVIQNFSDPVSQRQKAFIRNNRILMNLTQVSYGIDRSHGLGMPRSMGRIRPLGATIENRKTLLTSRFSYAATINCHLSYEVYCLRFDRTGRYFFTGADDYLVKVFCIGESLHPQNRNGGMDPASYARGAVLVCTLKGHAGVINDIEVSSDNSFLATASEDGDCRVWGLSDGCPVAILRGHTGGANMVSWSLLTPYRLVTTGADGLARTWDIREACLKRYGRLIGKRPEYLLCVDGKDLTVSGEQQNHERVKSAGVKENGVAFPTVHVGNEIELDDVPPLPRNELVLSEAIPPPPLPPAAGALVEVQNHDDDGLGNSDGQFVANDCIDAGVKLVSKMQHGASVDERMGGPGTRARRSAVKVLCVARCPHGGHLATGSDDGICRLWQEEDNLLSEKVDSLCIPRGCTVRASSFKTSRRMTSDRPILTLKGHLSSITDLKYSKRGDRLLTASQKDGVVRIWSWKTDPASMANHPLSVNQSNDSITHILLKLINPKVPVSVVRQGPRSRASRNQSTTVSCDSAIWVQDDTKVVTSQSELNKQNSNNIVAASQYLFLWDSISGNCLLGIAGGHTAPCPVILPHPLLPSIVCSAGSDGVMKVWDWETGSCLFTHLNTKDFGPVEGNERGSSCGYLDGDFSPDGTSVVLADDSGRITVFDSKVLRTTSEDGKSDVAALDWMREQYFSNDYYNLSYDVHGYCVERGSEMPPHLAPKGARCSHLGSSFSTIVNETFKGLTGPIPIEEDAARWTRQSIRDNGIKMRVVSFSSRGNMVRQYDPKTARIFQHSQITKDVISFNDDYVGAVMFGTPQSERVQASNNNVDNSARRLSSNYRWIGPNDIQEDDDQEPDRESDDEDFELGETSRGRSLTASQESDDDDLELEKEERAEPSRASSRQKGRRQVTEEGEDSSDEFVEYMSTNNQPSGPFVLDYNLHFFKMNSASQASRVKRLWVRRNESTSSYEGRKKYTPQIGDSVVYIPRAHLETIGDFPSVDIPWQSWPDEAAWPVIRCCVRNIRYRFPYKTFWNNSDLKCESIVAKVTLEVTGIPELPDHLVGWPSYSFTDPTKSYAFELSVFENENSDFVVPFDLYVSRLKQLEEAFTGTSGIIQVEAIYGDDQGPEDAEFTSWSGQAVSFSDDPDNGQQLSHPSLSGSGYASIRIVWDHDGNEDALNPWEVSVKDAETPDRPKLSEYEKKNVHRAINTVRNLPNVTEYFRLPVDESTYSDYATRVEVPIDLMFIVNRLEADYYSSKYSVLADIRLIQTNCAKYNGDNDEMTALATEMLARMEEIILTREESIFFHKYDFPISDSVLAAATSDAVEDIAPIVSAVVQRRSQRQRRAPRSILEDVIAPAEESLYSRTTRASQRLQSSRRRAGVSRAQIDNSVLESFEARVAPTLEQLTSNGLARGRSSRNRQIGRRNGSIEEDLLRRSVRTGSIRSNSEDVPSDTDGIMETNPPTSMNISRQSTLRSHIASNTRSGAYSNGATAHRSIRVGLRNGRSQDTVQAIEENSHSTSRPRQSQLLRRHDESDDISETNMSPARRLTRRSTRSSQKGSTPSKQTDTHKVTGARKHMTKSSTSSRRKGISRKEEPNEKNESNFPSTRRPTRHSPRALRTGTRQSGNHIESDATTFSEEEDDESEVEKSNESEFDEGDDDQDLPSNDDLSSHSESDFEATHDRSRTSTRRVTRKNATVLSSHKKQENPESPFRSSHKRSTENRSSYIDLSNSGSSGDDEFANPPKVSRLRGKSKSIAKSSKRKANTSALQRKRQKFAKEDRRAQIHASMQSFGIPAWPEIASPHISKVTNEIISRLSEMDEGGNFAVPVVEAFPHIYDEYLAGIPYPMDFRTIQEERLVIYKSITELQEDLILVFSNCMKYNESGSDLYLIALTIMESLEQTFHAACGELRVRPLHHPP